MSTIQTQLVVSHLSSSLSISSAVQRTAVGSTFTANAIEVLAVDETIPLGDVTTAQQVVLKLVSGDAVRVGIEHSGVAFDDTYPFRLAAAGEALLLRLDVEGLVETSTITTIADTAGSLDGDYFSLEGNSGTWAVWYDVDNSGTAAPAHGKTNALEITSVVTGNSAILVADRTATALAASTAFSADFTIAHTVGTTLITLTDKHTGTRTDIAANTSGFAVATTQPGAASPVIHLLSLGTSSVVVGVVPA